MWGREWAVVEPDFGEGRKESYFCGVGDGRIWSCKMNAKRALLVFFFFFFLFFFFFFFKKKNLQKKKQKRLLEISCGNKNDESMEANSISNKFMNRTRSLL